MNPLIDELHDIVGIDSISIWPLAMGWWLLIVCGILFFAFSAFFIYRKLCYKRSWKNDAFAQLQALDERLNTACAKESAALLSEYLRRIAISLFSRSECAGLCGNRWLEWLSAHDPKRFDWQKNARFLIEAPYAKNDLSLPKEDVRGAIRAAKRWLK